MSAIGYCSNFKSCTLTFLTDIGISIGYLYLMMGVIISSAVLPVALTLLWSKQNTIAATLSPILGLASSLIAWLVTAKKEGGTLSVASTGSKYATHPRFLPPPLLPNQTNHARHSNPMLAGNVVALLSPIIYIPLLTYAFGPQNYDYASMKLIRRASDHDVAAAHHVDPELVPGSRTVGPEAAALEQRHLKRASVIAKSLTAFMTVALLVLWPMPLYGTGYVFSRRFFTGWVSVGILWLFGSAVCVGLYPLWEGRGSLLGTVRSVVLDLRGLRGPVVQGRRREGDGEVEREMQGGSEGSRTPVEVGEKVVAGVEGGMEKA